MNPAGQLVAADHVREGVVVFGTRSDAARSFSLGTSPNIWSISNLSLETLDLRSTTEPTLPKTVNRRSAQTIAARSLIQRTGRPAIMSSSIATNGNAAYFGNWLANYLSPTGCRLRDRLIVRFKSDHADEGSDFPDGSLTIPWRKPPSKRSRQILLAKNAARVRST
jgi:hypothetical protein